MGKSLSRAGWLFAAIIAFGWYVSGHDEARPPPRPSAAIPSPKQTPEPTSNPVPAAPVPFYTAPTSNAVVEERLFTTANVNMRSDARAEAGAIMTIPSGSQVVALGMRGAWRGVRYGGKTGWVASRYLAAERPQPKPVPKVSVPVEVARPAQRSRKGEPVRGPMVGRCDCPYDLMRNGRLCGGRSAYSRPGGRSPVCYW